ncbi:MAG: TIGR04283 family arsenosugar biosynthesis glycosyltransferase [Bryobacteraceae bacterium]
MTVSAVVPTYNEESTIAGLLENLTAAGPDEIIVSDGGSADRTVEIARRSAQVVISPAGRARQMNEGARKARGDVLLFLHADVRVEPGSLRAIREAMCDPAVVGGNLDIRYEGGDLAASAFTRINRARCRFGIFYGDSGIFCRRSFFEQEGGYREWLILEDYDFARRMWRAGGVVLLSEPIYVSDRRWRKAGLLPTLWSWFWIQGLYLAGVSPERLARMYRDVR